MRREAAFPAASSVGVACSPRVGVPSILRVVSGGSWMCAGVIRTASDACFGGVCWGVRPRVSWGVWWGWGGAGPPVVVCPSWVWVVAPAVVPFSSVPWSPLPPLPGSWVVSCPHVVSLPASCPCECLPSLVENKNRLGCFHPRLWKSKIHGVNFELFNDGAKAYKTKVQHFSKVLMYAFRLQKRPLQPVYNMKHGCTWDTK